MVVPPFRSRRAAGRRRVLGAAAGGAALLLTPWSTVAAQTPTPTPPGVPRDIVDTAAAAGQFTTLVRALQVAGLVDTLKGPGPFTVFAPTDAAFAKVPTEQLNAVLADHDLLAKILTYHVAAGRIPASDLVTRTGITTVQGEPITVAAQGSTVTLNGSSRVLATDVAASNGIIHVVDTVLIPPTMATPAATPTPSNPNVARDGQTLASQPQSVQQFFQSVWGDQAAARWVEEHNAALGSAGR